LLYWIQPAQIGFPSQGAYELFPGKMQRSQKAVHMCYFSRRPVRDECNNTVKEGEILITSFEVFFNEPV